MLICKSRVAPLQAVLEAGSKAVLGVDGIGLINHTHRRGPVVFIFLSSATKVIETITLRIEIVQWCTQSSLPFLGHLEDMTLIHYTPMVILLGQYIHLDLRSKKLIIYTYLIWTTFYSYHHATKNVLELGLFVCPFHNHTST